MCIRDRHWGTSLDDSGSPVQPSCSTLLELQAPVEPVSYTHLDVYKRQVLKRK